MTMLSTSAFYERATRNIGSLRGRAESLQTALGTGQKLSRSSDDPVAASRLRSLTRADAMAAIDTTNAARAASDLTLTDSALSSFAGHVIRAQELATQAASGLLTGDQRKGIATELAQLGQEIARLANARDSVGHALFGGETAGAAYTFDAAGNPVYAGTASAGEMPLGDGQSVTRGLTGPEFLNFTGSSGATDLFAVIGGLAAALDGGSADPAQAARDALGDLDRLAPRLGQSRHPVALALEYRKTDLRLQQLDLFADARLRGVQRFRRRGNVVPVTMHFKNAAELGQLHGGACRSALSGPGTAFSASPDSRSRPTTPSHGCGSDHRRPRC